MTKPVVAIIGKQNAGKSTLLNRLAGKRIAITEDLPGTTRDRIISDVTWEGTEFTLVDTGGLEIEPDSIIGRGVNEQIDSAIATADVLIFLVDIRNGVSPTDHDVADLLRRSQKPVVLAANKADNDQMESDALEFYELGLGEPLPISAHHGRGTADLLDRVVALLPASMPVETAPNTLGIAIVGRPNVGKSMLLNALLGEERVLVSEVPGTTRDAIDTTIRYEDKTVLLIDTAGIRRRGKLERGIEKYSVNRSMKAIERADIALLVVDATEPFTAQDVHVGGYIRQLYKGIIIVVNKWDIAENKDINEWNLHIRNQLRFMAYAPIIYTSALLSQGIERIMPQVDEIYQERTKRLSTSAVNNIVQQAVADHNLPRKGSKRLKILYATQAEVNPPTFVFFVNDPKLIHFSYERYLENKLRDAFGFIGTPLRLIFKSRSENARI